MDAKKIIGMVGAIGGGIAASSAIALSSLNFDSDTDAVAVSDEPNNPETVESNVEETDVQENEE
jgi:hypothetical protein